MWDDRRPRIAVMPLLVYNFSFLGGESAKRLRLYGRWSSAVGRRYTLYSTKIKIRSLTLVWVGPVSSRSLVACKKA